MTNRLPRFEESGRETYFADMLGHVLETSGKDSLRLITRGPGLEFSAKLPAGEWTHVAATVDGESGKRTLFVNGKEIISK